MAKDRGLKRSILLLAVGILFIISFISIAGSEAVVSSDSGSVSQEKVNYAFTKNGTKLSENVGPLGPDVGYCQPSYCDVNVGGVGISESSEGPGGSYCCSGSDYKGYEECTNYKTKSTAYVIRYYIPGIIDKPAKSETDYCKDSNTLMEAYIDCEWASQDDINFLEKNCKDLNYYSDWVYYCEGNQVKRAKAYYDYSCSDGACKYKIPVTYTYETLSQKGDDSYCNKRKEGVDKGWSGCSLCAKNDYDCDYTSECASGLECMGPIGGAADGCCKPGETWDTTNYECCECTSGACCDGCHYKSSSIVCNSHISGTDQFSCRDGNCLDNDVFTRYQKQSCSGTSSSCSGTKDYVTSTYSSCSSSQFCSGSTSWGTTIPICKSATCTSGACCDTTCGVFNYRPSSYICDNSLAKWGCPWGNNLGNDVGKKTGNQYCSGSLTSCSGSTVWGSWGIFENCDSTSYCDGGESTSSKYCKYIACSSDSDCNQDYWYNLKCQDNDVYGNFVDYKCNSPGTTQASCTSTDTFKVKTDCGDSEDKNICWFYSQQGEYYSKGYTVKEHTERLCSNAECDSWGTMTWIKQCQQGCTNGICDEDVCFCSSWTNGACGSAGGCSTGQRKQTRTCTPSGCQTEAQCVTDASCNIACSKNSDCGVDSWVGSTSCSSDDVFQNWRTWTCNSPGTQQASCSSSDLLKLKTDCGVDSCGAWGNNICKNDNVYQSRTCHDLGCSLGSCFDTPRTEEQLIENCSLKGGWVELERESTSTSSADLTFGKSYSRGQTLKFSQDVYAYKACFYGKYNSYSAANNVYLDIYSTSGGLPTGAKLSRATLTKSSFSSSNKLICADFTSPIKLTANTQYALIMSSPSSTSNSAYKLRVSGTTNPYANGNYVYSDNSALSWKNGGSTKDLYFSVYGGNREEYICSNGVCVKKGEVICSTNLDCGVDEYTGSPYCSGSNVWQNFRTYTCLNPGTQQSNCSYADAGKQKEVCINGCSNGACIGIQCSGTDTSCGVWPSCLNCNLNDGCSGDAYRNYYCSSNSLGCSYTSDSCNDCSCSCGGYNTAETTANGNCNDGKDNDCDGKADGNDPDCQQACVDSDGGLNYYIKGTMTYQNTSYTDYCYSTSYLIEFYCVGGGYQAYKCPNGCLNGVCK